MSEVRDNPDELRYELLVDGERVGHIAYTRDDEGLTFVHTEVEPAHEGEGLGGRLVRGALDDARARGLRVDPVCPFVAAWVRRHPEYGDVAS